MQRSHQRLIVLVSLLVSGMAAAQVTDSPTQELVRNDHADISHYCPELGSVTFTGSDNVIEVHGACQTVTITGSRNQVSVDTADAVQVNGDDNQVHWDAAHTSAHEPKFAISGARNTSAIAK